MFDAHNVKPRFSHRGGGALLHLDLPKLRDCMTLDGETWTAKREFHVTLIGKGLMRSLVDELGLLSLPRIETAIVNARRNVPFRVHTREELWWIREEAARTIIQMSDVDGGETFFHRLEDQLGAAILRPPYHVTLYTVGTSKGIGIASDDVLRELGRAMTADEMATYRAAQK